MADDPISDIFRCHKPREFRSFIRKYGGEELPNKGKHGVKFRGKCDPRPIVIPVHGAGRGNSSNEKIISIRNKILQALCLSCFVLCIYIALKSNGIDPMGTVVAWLK